MVDERHVDILVGMRYDYQATSYLMGACKKVSYFHKEDSH